MWKPPYIEWRKETLLLNGINQIIKDGWPELTLYFTKNGWIRR